jgi:hypothetical protein
VPKEARNTADLRVELTKAVSKGSIVYDIRYF